MNCVKKAKVSNMDVSVHLKFKENFRYIEYAVFGFFFQENMFIDEKIDYYYIPSQKPTK